MTDVRTVETAEYDPLFSGLNRSEIKTYPVTVASGASLKRGALVTYASGKVSAVTAESTSVFGILCDDVDASKSDADGTVYVNGDFNKAAVVVASGVKIDDFILPARNVGIFLR